MRARPSREKPVVAGEGCSARASTTPTEAKTTLRQASADAASKRRRDRPLVLKSLLVLQRLIDQLLQRRLDLLAFRRGLLQQHEEHVLLRVDHEAAAAGAVPFQFAELAGRGRLGVAGIGAHPDAQPVAESIAGKIEIVAVDARIRT